MVSVKFAFSTSPAFFILSCLVKEKTTLQVTMQPEDGHSTTLQEFIIDPPVPATSVEVYVVSVYQSYHNGFAEIVAYGNMMSYVI